MPVGKRLVAGLVMLLCVAGLLLSLGAGVGVWLVKEPLTARVTRIFERLDHGLDIVNQCLDHARTSLDRAAERLEAVKQEQKRLAQEPERGTATRRRMARTIQQSIAPQFNNASEDLHTVAEAAVVLNSVLEDLGNFPFLAATGLDVDRLKSINTQLSAVESSAWEFTRLLGEPSSDADADTAGASLSRMEQSLKTMQGWIAEYGPQAALVHQRTQELKTQTLDWITPASVTITLVCFWIAVSQISLCCHAWSWWKALSRKSPVGAGS